MFGEIYVEDILKICVSDNTIIQCIQDMSQGVESQAIANIKEADFFVVQLDESTYITGKFQLLAFSRYVCNEDITEQF
jgi:hypothetical protein